MKTLGRPIGNSMASSLKTGPVLMGIQSLQPNSPEARPKKQPSRAHNITNMFQAEQSQAGSSLAMSVAQEAPSVS